MVEINLVGTFNAMRLIAADIQVLEPLQDGERGVIICTASVAGYEGQIGQAAYAASKGGVIALVLPAAREFAQFGIRVNGVAPGPVETEMLNRFTVDAGRKAGLVAGVPLKRAGAPEEILLDAEDVSIWLKVSEDWVWDHASRRAPFLPAIWLSDGALRFKRSKIAEFIDERERLSTKHRKRR